VSVLISLTPDEVNECSRTAQEIMALKSSDHRVDRTQSDYIMSMRGLLSEKAVAKFLRINMNDEAHYGGDAGHDLIWKGLKIQVKYNTHWDGSFYVRDLKMMTADIGILVRSRSLDAEPLVMSLIGWITHRNFHLLQKVEKYKTPVFSVQQHQLEPFTTVEEFEIASA